MTIDPGQSDMGQSDRRDNGLVAPSYVPITDLAAPVAPQVLTALGRARIAAYLADVPTSSGAVRLWVASGERSDARTIVAAVVRAAGGTAGSDPLDGIDADAEFAALVADWHVDTHVAIRNAEKDLTREDEDWRARLRPPTEPDETPWIEDDHYIPPPPPPLPRFAAPTIIAMAVIAISILVLGFGGQFGLASQLTMLLGVIGLLFGAGILVHRLREHGDDDDDGAVL